MTSRKITPGMRFWHFIALAMSMLLLYSVLVVAFHHDDDDQDHDDDCAVCAVAHHRAADITTTFPGFNYLPVTHPAFFAVFVLIFIAHRFHHSDQNRAPPL